VYEGEQLQYNNTILAALNLRIELTRTKLAGSMFNSGIEDAAGCMHLVVEQDKTTMHKHRIRL